jgi:hypothetical protein
MSLAHRAARGAIAGTLATLPMSVLMLAAQRAGWLTEQPPERITAVSLKRTAGDSPDGLALDALTAVVHLGVGAAAGAVYGAMVEPLRPERVPPAAWGAIYGSLFWALSYVALLPALGLMPPPARDERRRPPVMLASHCVFGGVLGVLTAQPVR